MTSEELSKAIRERISAIASERDKLRALLEEASSVEDSANEAIRILEEGADKLSEYV